MLISFKYRKVDEDGLSEQTAFGELSVHQQIITKECWRSIIHSAKHLLGASVGHQGYGRCPHSATTIVAGRGQRCKEWGEYRVIRAPLAQGGSLGTRGSQPGVVKWWMSSQVDPEEGHDRERHGQKPRIFSEQACFFGGPTSHLFVCCCFF